MSNITTVFDFLKSEIVTALPQHSELANSYFPETEAELKYAKAFGIGIGEASISDVENFIVVFKRQFIISIVRKCFTYNRNSVTRQTTEKDLIEDELLVIKQVFSNTKQNSWKLPYIKALSFIRDAGIDFVRVDREDILILRFVVEIDYHEQRT